MNFYSFINNRISPKSILIIFFSSTTILGQPKITIQDLTPSSIEKLQAFSKNNPGPFTIDVVPQKEWLAALTGFLATPFTALRNSLSFKNISLTLLSGALSLGWVSYLLCTYLIYKTYRVLKNVHSWANWCSDDDLLSDYDALYRKLDHHKRSRTTKKPTLTLMTLQQEKNLLTSYVRIDSFLRKHQVRNHFPHADRKTQVQITCAYAKLQKAEELLAVRKKECFKASEPLSKNKAH